LRVNAQPKNAKNSDRRAHPCRAQLLDGYKAVRLSLRHEVEEQAQMDSLKFVRDCDEVLADLSSGHLDYRLPS
jgi:hypothetical protein